MGQYVPEISDPDTVGTKAIPFNRTRGLSRAALEKPLRISLVSDAVDVHPSRVGGRQVIEPKVGHPCLVGSGVQYRLATDLAVGPSEMRE